MLNHRCETSNFKKTFSVIHLYIVIIVILIISDYGLRRSPKNIIKIDFILALLRCKRKTKISHLKFEHIIILMYIRTVHQP